MVEAKDIDTINYTVKKNMIKYGINKGFHDVYDIIIILCKLLFSQFGEWDVHNVYKEHSKLYKSESSLILRTL